MRWLNPKRALGIASLAMLSVLASASPAPAHIVLSSAGFVGEMGWAEEPPLAGVRNAFELTITDSSGSPVDAPSGALSVEIGYGNQAVSLPLVPAASAGVVEAEFVPPKAGAYAFLVSGTLQGRNFELTTGCSAGGMECVKASGGEFMTTPAPAGAQPSESSSGDSSDSPTAAIAAVMLALGAAATAAIVLWGRRRRT